MNHIILCHRHFKNEDNPLKIKLQPEKRESDAEADNVCISARLYNFNQILT